MKTEIKFVEGKMPDCVSFTLLSDVTSEHFEKGLVKIMVDTLIFVGSYLVQKKLVFKSRMEKTHEA